MTTKLERQLNITKTDAIERLGKISSTAKAQYFNWVEDDEGVDLIAFMPDSLDTDDLHEICWTLERIHSAECELQELRKRAKIGAAIKVLFELFAEVFSQKR